MTAVVLSAAKDLAVRRSSATMRIRHRRKIHHRGTEDTEKHRDESSRAVGAPPLYSVSLGALCASVVNSSYAYPMSRKERT